MKGTLIPVHDFLDPAIRASETVRERYAGLAVVLDREAERRSRLLADLVRDARSIDGVTRTDLLVLVPGPDDLATDWVLNPEVGWHGVGASGVELVVGATDPMSRERAWSESLWELVANEVERLDVDEEQERLRRAIDSSTSDLCDYLGLGEDDVPSLVVFSFAGPRVFVFRYGGERDDSPYELFKQIAVRRNGVPG
jgi:hypothetical protein